MNKEHLKSFVEQNPKLVKMAESSTWPGLFVLKYSKRVFYDSLWCPELEHCRGTIIDADFNLVSYPFQKIYNYQIESRAPVLADDVEVTAFRKVNGFMAAVTVHNGELLVSTTGSTDSPYVDMAREMMITHAPLADWLIVLNSEEHYDLTFMFECVHPADPHIIPEKPGMYLLGYREKAWGSQVGYNVSILHDLRSMLNCYMPEYHQVTMADVKVMAKECRHEGYVAYTQDGQAFKIKSPHYLTSKWVARNPRTDKLMSPQFREQIDEEYYDLLSAIQQNIVAYTALDEQARLAWVRNYLEMV